MVLSEGKRRASVDTTPASADHYDMILSLTALDELIVGYLRATSTSHEAQPPPTENTPPKVSSDEIALHENSQVRLIMN